jgi:UDP-4-amino-4,6-dideoxy-N-acetyl-beta-L-altrosamine N-acetyltransferase
MSDYPTVTGQLRPMTHDDLAMVLVWRNQADVRGAMYTQQEIGLAQHRAWFDRTLQEGRKALFVYEADGQASGFVHIDGAHAGAVADWGFYAAPGAPRGTGRALGRSALAHAFANVGVHKVCGEVLAYNVRSLRLHEALGFKREGELRQQYFDGQAYHDVICFGLLKPEWLAIFEK